MDYEPEMIKQQMSETRSSLGDKLETLEQKVTETVKDATRAVSETVQTVSDTVDTTVSNISESVETVKESVKETFNLTGHIERNPWVALGASVAAGYALGMLLPTPRQVGISSPTGQPPAVPPSAEPATFASSGSAAASSAEPSPWASLFDQLKGLALGATAAVARDAIAEILPESMKPSLGGIINSFTESLGVPTLDLQEEQRPSPFPSTSPPHRPQPVV